MSVRPYRLPHKETTAAAELHRPKRALLLLWQLQPQHSHVLVLVTANDTVYALANMRVRVQGYGRVP